MRPALIIDIVGLEGFDQWPLADSVAHVVPDDDVVLRGLPTPDCEVDIYHGDIWVTSVTVVEYGSMVLPSHLFDSAIERRLKLVLKIHGEVYGGYIIFLPIEESEPFPNDNTLLRSDGATASRESYVTTDYIDITFVDDIVYVGRMSRSSGITMGAYDGDRNFVGALIVQTPATQSTYHIVPDGSYNYIRACTIDSVEYSLQVHYKTRRRG